jgi:predicted metalloprotease with PDZ domain
LTGRHDADCERLSRDLRKVCAAQARFFEPETGHAPFDHYLFQVTVVGDGYGGLEHRSSTALITRREDLPWQGMRGTPEGYRRFLGLCSHEYFHAWHVKRIKPQAFVRYNLGAENYTRLLWIFEGFTSYYDDLMLARAGVLTTTDYLGSLAQTIAQVIRAPGRFRQSLSESSHDAWIKYYRQDENAPNAIVSYYAKGALLALSLDALIRSQTKGASSLDDVMRLLWRRYGRDFYDREGRISPEAKGLEEDGFAAIVHEATGLSLNRTLSRWVDGTVELPLARLLKSLGIQLNLKSSDNAAGRLGLRLSESGGRLRVTHVLEGGTAGAAGVSAGDEFIAIDGIRSDLAALNRRVNRLGTGKKLMAHLFRRDELMQVEIEIGRASVSDAHLSLIEDADDATRALRESWLSGH